MLFCVWSDFYVEKTVKAYASAWGDDDSRSQQR
jgi:hypothetical protein